MKSKNKDITDTPLRGTTCFGTGLVALDVILNGNPNTDPKLLAGGSCGNVLLILAFLGWNSYPISRLSKNSASKLIVEDLKNHNVKLDLITRTKDGSTPVIIHRIVKDSDNNPKHKFEFRIPKTNIWLPSYKPVLSKKIQAIIDFPITPKVFYLDRISRGAIDLATFYKGKGGIVFFEPSSITNPKQFKECLAIADIVKFSNDRIPQFKNLYPIRQAPIEIETLGSNGLLYRSNKNENNEWHFLPAIQIDNAIDLAGAGDWCSAGLIHATINSLGNKKLNSLSVPKLEQALKFGQFLSALNCNFYGARGLMYNVALKEIKTAHQNFLKTGKIDLKAKESGFLIKNAPFNFSKIV